MNNLVFGKIIQNNRNQREIRLVENERTRNQLASSVNFKGIKDISDFLWILEMKKEVKMSSSTFACELVLGLSKVLIYEFYLDYMIPKRRKNVNLLYMDTDIP